MSQLPIDSWPKDTAQTSTALAMEALGVAEVKNSMFWHLKLNLPNAGCCCMHFDLSSRSRSSHASGEVIGIGAWSGSHDQVAACRGLTSACQSAKRAYRSFEKLTALAGRELLPCGRQVFDRAVLEIFRCLRCELLHEAGLHVCFRVLVLYSILFSFY